MGDRAVFESLIAQMLTANNDQRQAAEAAFNDAKKNPDALAGNLMQSLRGSTESERRALCAVMVRKVLTKDDPSLWPRLSPQMQGIVKQELLNGIRSEQERSILKKICDTTSELAAVIVDENGWPELLPFIFQCVQSQNPREVESALLIFAQLAHYLMGTLKQFMGTLNDVLRSCLQSPVLDVAIAAMRATTAFIQELDDGSERNKFQSMIPTMLATVATVLNAGEEVAAQEVLEMFIEVAEAHPRFLRRQLSETVSAMLQIAEADTLEDSTRQLAAEFLVTLCEAREKAPGMMRKLPQFIGRLFQCLITFLLDIEDEPNWHSADSDKYESEGEGERYEFGQECLDRLALALGGNTIVPLASSLLPQLLTSQDWRQRHAALICLAQIAEGCAKVMQKILPALVDMCLQGLSDPHPKVRWAACQALGQMCTDLGPELQNAEHARILPGLMAVMDDFSQPRVQAHAAAALVNLSENCEQDLLPPYLDVLISKLLVALQNGQRMVQEGSLTAMASVADCAKTHFIKFYDQVMPLLRQILTHATDKTHHLLRAKALECISLVGMAIGRERFRTDAHQVLQYMQSQYMQALQSEQPVESDDPTITYMLQAGARLCKCLGEEFLPYLDVVMPPLLRSAQLKPDVNVADNDTDEDDEEDDEVETIYMGDRKISIRTTVLEEKATACNMLCCYADELKEGFYPYVEQITGIMVPLLRFYFHEEVRQAAVQSLPELLRSAYLAAKTGKHGATLAVVKQLLDFIWPPLMDAMSKEPDTEVLSNMLEAVEEIVDIAAPDLLTMEQLGAAFERFKVVLDTSTQRRHERLQRRSAEDFDQEEAEAVEDENEEEEDLLDQLASALTVILRSYADRAMPYIDGIMPQLAQLLDAQRSVQERRIGVCIMDDILEHSAAGSQKYMGSVLPVLLEACKSQDANLRQSAVYGIGVLAQYRPEGFAIVAATAITTIVNIINAPDSRSEDNAMATENAIAALGKVLQYQQHVVDAAQGMLLGDTWLQALPVVEDAVEAQNVHRQLVTFIEASDPRILGEGNKNLGKIVSVLAVVLSRGNALVEADVAAKMVTLLNQMQSSLPPQVMQGLVSQLKPKESHYLQQLLSGQAVPQ